MIQKTAVIVLFIIAVGLGFMIFKNKAGDSPQEQVSRISDSNPSNNQAVIPSLDGPLITPEPGREKEYLFSVNMDSSEEDKLMHFYYALSVAQGAEFINVTDCDSSPLVFKAKLGSDIKLKNDGNGEIVLIHDQNHTYRVAPNSTKTIKADFGMGPALYGYGCNTSNGPAGFILVTPEQ